MKKALITGGSRGIGKSIVKKFEENGYVVTAPNRNEMDLSDASSVIEFIDRNKNEYFNVIVNNAGINDINLIEDVTDDEIRKIMQVNLISPVLILRAFVRKMKENQYGRIVNIGSIWASVSKEGRSIYSASKNGIHGVTNTLAVELASYNVMVNTICPGYTLTELTKKNNSVEDIEEIAKKIPIGRMAKPEEIAEVVMFLGGERNTYLTGQKIIVDGGFTII